MGLRIKEDPPDLPMRHPSLATPSAAVGTPRARRAPTALANRSNATREHTRNQNTLAKRLAGKAFVLDIVEQKDIVTIQRDLQKFGGTVVYDIDEVNLPYMLVSDHAYAKQFENRDADQAKPKAIDMRKVPMMIRQAVDLNINIRHTDSFLKSLVSMKRKYGLKSPGRPSKMAKANPKGVLKRRLTGNFIRIDDMNCQFAPSIREYRDCYAPSINLGMYFGQSLFHLASEEQMERRKAEIEEELKNGMADEEGEDPEELVETGETTERVEFAEAVQPETADASQKAVKPRYSPGFCENCQKSFKDQNTHFGSVQHKKTISKKGFYDEVDSLLGSFVSNIQCPGKPMLRRRKPPSKEPSPELDPDFEYYPEKVFQ